MAATDTLHNQIANLKIVIPTIIAAVLFFCGLVGIMGPALGYGLFLVATLLLLVGLISFGIFILTKKFNTSELSRFFGHCFWLGAWCYVLAVAALAGFYIREALYGQMDLKWIIFGPAILVALIVLDWGLYRIIVGKNIATWQRYGDVISRDAIDEHAMQQTLVDEVLLHRTLYKTSSLRWLRHQLIFWGFGVMFAVELVAVFFREALPAFGFRDIWEEPTHFIRLAFDTAFEITGLMIFVGCILALYFRFQVNGTPDQKYTDTPTTLFLLIVVISGFIVEGMRIASAPGELYHIASPIGWLFAHAFGWMGSAPGRVYDGIWLFHVLASCAFIAYVPIKRLVHSCATPIGRLMNSQKSMLAAKKEQSLKGLFQRRLRQ